MLEIYGRQWEASFGHIDGDAFATWRDALMEFTPHQIKRGLDAVRAEGHEFPPNLIKFCRLCRGVKEGPPQTYQLTDYTGAAARDGVARPDPETNRIAWSDLHHCLVWQQLVDGEWVDGGDPLADY